MSDFGLSVCAALFVLLIIAIIYIIMLHRQLLNVCPDYVKGAETHQLKVELAEMMKTNNSLLSQVRTIKEAANDSEDEAKTNKAEVSRLKALLVTTNDEHSKILNRALDSDKEYSNRISKLQAKIAEISNENAELENSAKLDAIKSQDDIAVLTDALLDYKRQLPSLIDAEVKSRLQKMDLSDSGYIYIMACKNPNMVKIGKTNRSPEQRLGELNRANYGGQNTWRVHKSYRVGNIKKCEALAHNVHEANSIKIESFRECFTVNAADATYNLDTVLERFII